MNEHHRLEIRSRHCNRSQGLINAFQKLADTLSPLGAFEIADEVGGDCHWISKLHDCSGPEFVSVKVIHTNWDDRNVGAKRHYCNSGHELSV